MAGMTFRRTNGAIGDGVAGKEFAMTLFRFVKSWLEYYSIILSYLARLAVILYDNIYTKLLLFRLARAKQGRIHKAGILDKRYTLKIQRFHRIL